MLSTGDVHGCLRKLEALLRVIKYPGNVDYNGLSKGDPSAFLPIVSFALTSFSPPFAKQLMEAGLELTGKTDLRFTDALYKVLRDIFHYKPILTKQQFLQWGFSQRKISLICDIINLVVQKHNQLKKPRVRCPVAHKDDRGEAHPTLADADTGSIRPLVVNHMENSSHAEALCCSGVSASFHGGSPGHGIMLAGQEEDKENLLNSPEVEGRLSALEAQLRTLQSGLDRLSLLERRLEELDKRRNTDMLHEFQDGAQVISVSRENWENLMSRVLLLETKLDLSLPPLKVSPPCQSSASSHSSTSMCEASQEDLKDRLERITNLLKSTKSSTAPCK